MEKKKVEKFEDLFVWQKARELVRSDFRYIFLSSRPSVARGGIPLSCHPEFISGSMLKQVQHDKSFIIGLIPLIKFTFHCRCQFFNCFSLAIA
jgi:hypothetical protein